MTDDQLNRRAELLGLALAGELSADERRELDAAAALDPTIAAELRDLGALGRAVRESGYDDSAPSAGLRERIAAIAAEPVEVASGPPVAGVLAPSPQLSPSELSVPQASARASGRRRRWLAVVAAAACIGIGAGGVLGVQAIGSIPPQGPPGTLGVTETITFAGEPDGVEIDAALVAHTWGTETVLHIAGLDADATYSVVLVGAGGSTPSGSFHGSAVTIDCRLNASVMRAGVSEVDIVDAAGATVATATVPPVA